MIKLEIRIPLPYPIQMGTVHMNCDVCLVCMLSLLSYWSTVAELLVTSLTCQTIYKLPAWSCKASFSSYWVEFTADHFSCAGAFVFVVLVVLSICIPQANFSQFISVNVLESSDCILLLRETYNSMCD